MASNSWGVFSIDGLWRNNLIVYNISFVTYDLIKFIPTNCGASLMGQLRTLLIRNSSKV